MKTITLYALLCVLLAELSPAQSLRERITKEIKTYPQPSSVREFNPVFHFPPVNQDTTLICWSFATTSFIESEMKRLGLTPVKLSVVYPEYCVFLEKAGEFIATRGASRFAPGDLFTGVFSILPRYGALPEESYRGSVHSCKTLNQDLLYRELDEYMQSIRRRADWDSLAIMTQVRAILDRHLGAPPAEFEYRGTKYTPLSFVNNVVRIPWKEYIKVQSFLYAPFGAFSRLRVPDNWSGDTSYFNIPLDAFYTSLVSAIRAGYSVACDADISEPEYDAATGSVMVPASDLPRAAISQEAREFRFEDGSTQDDHLVHIVGYTRMGDDDWFLVKDSWRTAYATPHPGYLFVHGSYVKLKVLSFLVHQSALRLHEMH